MGDQCPDHDNRVQCCWVPLFICLQFGSKTYQNQASFALRTVELIYLSSPKCRDSLLFTPNRFQSCPHQSYKSLFRELLPVSCGATRQAVVRQPVQPPQHHHQAHVEESDAQKVKGCKTESRASFWLHHFMTPGLLQHIHGALQNGISQLCLEIKVTQSWAESHGTFQKAECNQSERRGATEA